MRTQYSNRPFADEFTGSPISDSMNGFIVRGSSAIGAGVALTAALAAIFVH